MPTTQPAAKAAALAHQGWPVLACHHPQPTETCSCGDAACASPAKHPRTRRGLHDATTDQATIRDWWARWPHANVGIRTGARPDGAGIVVVDIDPRHGGTRALEALVAAHATVPDTLEALTGGGGRHLYFAHPGGRVANSAGRLGPGLDVRGDGGYVLAPPSRHITGGHYQWNRQPLQPLPRWLHQLLQPPTPATARPTSHLPAVGRPGAWAAAALAAEVANVRTATPGSRNHALNRSAFALGQIVAGGHLDADLVAELLTDAALAVGLAATETDATVRSGLRAGARTPRLPRVS